MDFDKLILVIPVLPTVGTMFVFVTDLPRRMLRRSNPIKTRPAWAGFKTAEEGRANTSFGVSEPCGPRGEVNPQK